MKTRKEISVLLILIMLVTTFSACSTKSSYESVYLLGEKQIASEVAKEYYESATQKTESDIEGFIYNYREDGYISSLVGRFYDEPVTTSDEVLKGLVTVYDLLGIDGNTDYYLSSTIVNYDSNYTYYTFQQLWGDESVENASLVVVVDADNYVYALSNSFSPTEGLTPPSYTTTTEDAEALVAKYYPDVHIYSEYTSEVTINDDSSLTRVIAVYSDNVAGNTASDMIYTKHLIKHDGTYMYATSANNPSENQDKIYNNESYFEGLTSTTYSANVVRVDGTTVSVDVPVSYSEADGKYYLMDADRMIASADFYDFYYNGKVTFISSTNNADWDTNYLLAYANYVKVYDFFEYVGVESIDRKGVPLLLGMGFCDAAGESVDNACYCGTIKGWGFFGISDTLTVSQALDVCAHEYTHGYTGHAMAGSIYRNETGAINESLSDIMGNLIEMYLGETTDTQWLLGENAADVMRSMSNPEEYKQPEYVGDAYYCPSTDYPDANLNDYGGVHSNSSLLNKVCYDLYASGMSIEDELILWLDTIEFLTPESDYDDVYVGLVLAANAHGMESYVSVIDNSYETMGLFGDRKANAENAALRSGFFSLDVQVKSPYSAIFLMDTNQNIVDYCVSNQDGLIRIVDPVGSYYLVYVVGNGYTYTKYYYANGGWSTSVSPTLVNFSTQGKYDTVSIGY